METLVNPCRLVKLPSGSKGRDRRLAGNEEVLLLDAIEKAMPRTPCARTLLTVAIETGIRQSELLRLTWADIDLKAESAHAHVEDSKNGQDRDVPLSPVAVTALSALPRPIAGGRVFDIKQDRLIRAFAEACADAGIQGLTFHNLRHEAASRLAPRLQAASLAKLFGWKTIQMAMRYYHPTGQDLRRELNFTKVPVVQSA
jgi:integrase